MTTRLTHAVRRVPIKYMVRRFNEFVELEAAGGVLLLASTVVALLWANSPWVSSYVNLWQTTMTLQVGAFEISKPLLLWINDGLMAIFFFVVGLEIKREVLIGELATPRQAVLPIAGAIGGMLVPAALYMLINLGGPGATGWAIPMATDIAFALGVLALLGNRVPLSLKIFLTALAIVDDLGAVMVIALFYTAEIAWSYLAMGMGFLLILLLVNRLGVRSLLIYAVLGVGLWVVFLKSGVHATVAGVLLALTIPARARINPHAFVERSRTVLEDFERSTDPDESVLTNEPQQAAIQELEEMCTDVESPLQRLEHALHPWTAFFIMPVFALANAGVAFEANLVEALTQPVTLGIILGLSIGKPLGITLLSWLAVRSGLAVKPEDVSWLQLHGAGWICGIGFTMALFIATLAFGATPLLAEAKIGILFASLIAGIVGWILLSRGQPGPEIPAHRS
ncbi:MAG: Na(+)/H(+) antiporter NhaA [Herpetosiphonaceae bacterium]|nr:MAG: Na(+)/H(+) antiporter NhaA [Herpetosiphonaceae bacterium]